MSYLIELYKKIKRIKLIKQNRKRLINENFTILSSNCVGGIIYHELGKQFLSPTINLYICPSDFIKFLSNLNKYLDALPMQVNKNTDEYPIVKILDITIHGLHYKNFEEFVRKWESRKKRINFDNIYIIMLERDGCTYEDLIAFDKLPFENKIVFVHKEMPEIKSSYYIEGTTADGLDGHQVVVLTDYISKYSYLKYIDKWDFVKFINN
ncbi:MAG: DUF1919 domain-containing protein, partial [Bacilli bacterium]